MPALHPRTLRRIRDLLPPGPEKEAVERVLRRKPLSSARRKTKERREAKRGELEAIRTQLWRRAGGFCECGCCAPLFWVGESDHFWGRKREQSLESMWLLLPSCHRAKTGNRPSAAEWLRKFLAHCERHGYAEQASKARRRLAFIEARGGK